VIVIDAFEICLALSIIIVVLFFIYAMIEVCFFQPYATDKAQEICIERGFDNYKDYDKLPFSIVPLGVTCEYESKYLLNDGTAIVVAE
jgi:hypothetical protein